MHIKIFIVPLNGEKKFFSWFVHNILQKKRIGICWWVAKKFFKNIDFWWRYVAKTIEKLTYLNIFKKGPVFELKSALSQWQINIFEKFLHHGSAFSKTLLLMYIMPKSRKKFFSPFKGTMKILICILLLQYLTYSKNISDIDFYM